ncbi:oligopeptide transporter subunit; ATP-binding component of ABC superfamily [Bosea sp. 62]|uniref:ABC transporter ATP-binding protein n=1 Tax=unclassified Bosea (in: a-proteobacteria) TaxID=2653178 RepID=UPI001258E504|nr:MULTISPECIES: ABC transporter ATP-binding protein [unclassified Bosea (in: a-proteobacteria)]CAD5249064.1 oligopeptide transporter subunit; ATP-binding component of ABC superfamily [Bosea sp. 46]CAD5250110.1 oligopeptide transporter subunit; ATP-binding component of ABC superfamily [Bosea sp. 21B]CAD5265668.1 oligopeptide transporter subunit; ATP-binding component of ABC superfamily [Bosea sp. 7B]VVT44574.1 oligopeptide transporter subunit; ATP-binding component of ABC superfamily [Bosea sp.
MATMETAAVAAARADDDILLKVEDLQTHFLIGSSAIKSVDGVSFSLRRGQTLAVVGESGSGKSVTSLTIMRLLADPGRIVGGRILYRLRSGESVDLAQLPEKRMRAIRGSEIAMIFQEPMTSLNPLFTVGDQIMEMILLHEKMSRSQARARAKQMLELVEIPAAERRLAQYPHEMSGGMRQRVMIALALSCNPSLLIADEPTTALDVTIQAQILDLLRRLQAEIGMSILFITHNLGVVAEIAHEVAVMYAGRVVEQGPVGDLFARQRHPYTRGLLACIPDARRDRIPGQGRALLNAIPGNVPSPLALPPGCSYAPRCPLVEERCAKDAPPLIDVAAAHLTRCWRHDAL